MRNVGGPVPLQDAGQPERETVPDAALLTSAASTVVAVEDP